MLGAGDHGRLCLVDGHAVEEMAVHQFAVADIGLVAGKDLRRLVAVGDHAVDGQFIFAREVEVALVVRRAAEDRARAIIHQHIIDDPHGQMPVGVERMLDGKAGVEAQLVGRFQLLGRRTLTATFGDEGGEFGRILRQSLGQRRRTGGHKPPENRKKHKWPVALDG